MKAFFKSLVVWALTQEAKAVLRKYKPHVVAVTGNVGKTSTKDAVFAMMGVSERVRASQKSFNSELGVPLTILGLPNAWGSPWRWPFTIVDGLLVLWRSNYPEWLVLEVGADRPGDISSLAKWIAADVVVITRLPDVPVHVEFFDSVEAVIEEKAALIDALKPGGTLVLYGDDDKTRSLERRLPAHDARVLTYGMSAEDDVRGADFSLVREGAGQPLGMQGRIYMHGSATTVATDIPVMLTGALGDHAFLPLVAAAAVGQALGKKSEEIAEGLNRYAPPPGRMRLIAGIKDSLVIDDTYNSSPAALHAALRTLETLKPKHGHTIAVLGDMLELGRHSVDEHRKAGAMVAKCADLLVTVGFRARDLAQAALDNGMRDEQVLQYEDSRRAGDELKNFIQASDVVLVKGSQSMRMERVVEELMAEPERAKDMLVRQDEEWKKR